MRMRIRIVRKVGSRGGSVTRRLVIAEPYDGAGVLFDDLGGRKADEVVDSEEQDHDIFGEAERGQDRLGNEVEWGDDVDGGANKEQSVNEGRTTFEQEAKSQSDVLRQFCDDGEKATKRKTMDWNPHRDLTETDG